MTDRRRDTPEYMNQAIINTSEPARIAGGSPKAPVAYGPTNKFVCAERGWAWANAGGDYIGPNLIPQEPTPWASVLSPAGDPTPVTYDVDVTALAQHVLASGSWMALFIKAFGSTRGFASRFHSTCPPSSITYAYADGSTETLDAYFSAPINVTMPNQAAERMGSPAVIEFKKPSSIPVSATLHLSVALTYGTAAMINVWLCNPPRNTMAVELGISPDYPLDAGIEAHPDVLIVHRYMDGKAESDFVSSVNGINYKDRPNFSPHYWDETAPVDKTKLPFVAEGKWVIGHPKTTEWGYVESSYAEDGFHPLAEGMGAFRMVMPAQATEDGLVCGTGGTMAFNGHIYLPDEEFALADTIHVRWYELLTIDSFPLSRADLKHLYTYPGGVQPTWTDMGGKWGFAPAHQSPWTGSGGNGGSHGFNLRKSWRLCVEGTGGPADLGIRMQEHWYDFQGNNPVNYSSRKGEWGKWGDYGTIHYPGVWTCFETMCHLNGVTEPGMRPDGTPFINKHGNQMYFDETGYMKAWVNGKQVHEETGLVLRSLPTLAEQGVAPRSPSSYTPPREIGHTAVLYNWYHGGVNWNPVRQVRFITGLVVSKSYIGQMAGLDEATEHLPPIEDEPRVTATTRLAQEPDGTYSFGASGMQLAVSGTTQLTQEADGTYTINASGLLLDGVEPPPDPESEPEHEPEPTPSYNPYYDQLPVGWTQLVSGSALTGDKPHSGILAYSNAAIDPDGGRIGLFGGGHADYQGNEVWWLDLDTVSGNPWCRDYLPDFTAHNPDINAVWAKVDAATLPGGYVDTNRPYSRHTYNSVHWISSLSKLIIGGESTYSGTQGEQLWDTNGGPHLRTPQDTWLYDPASKKWEFKGSTLLDQNYLSATYSAYHQGRDKLYAVERNTAGYWTVREYDPKTNKWTKLPGVAKGTAIEIALAVDVSRDRILVMGGASPINNTLWSYSLMTLEWDNLTPASGPVPPAAPSYGLTVDTARDKYLACKDAVLWEFDPLTGKWTQMQSVGQTVAHVKGRLLYDAVRNVTFLVFKRSGSTHVDVWVHRHG